MCPAVYSQIWVWELTSLLGGDDCGLQGLSPALSRLSGQSEDVRRFRGQLCGCELPYRGTHLDGGEGVGTATGQAVGNLVPCGRGWGQSGESAEPFIFLFAQKTYAPDTP